jgi:hypothetical protein
MDVPLRQYLDRSRQIITKPANIIARDKDELCEEFRIMIQHLQDTLADVIKDYAKICTNGAAQPFDLLTAAPIEIDNIDFVESAPVKWVPEINQYVLRINNMTLRGNIGNIYSKRMVTSASGENIGQLVPCKMGMRCHRLKAATTCKFWHDPMQLVEMRRGGLISAELFKEQVVLVRNYTNTSWLYTDCARDKSNEYMRSFGSRAYIKNDLLRMKISKSADIYEEIERFKNQVMHDILVLLLINEN